MEASAGTETTYFVGGHYQVVDDGTTRTILKYYYAGAQRIAMRTNGTLNFLLGDHLGSTSLVTDANGHNPIETRYTAWGEIRYSSGLSPTDYTYTGQYSYTADFGLMFYNARWYDSSLGRFAQADSIIPGGVQGLDRYAYVNNSPINYTDPSGHKCVPVEECEGYKPSANQGGSFDITYGISFSGDWEEDNQTMVRDGVRAVANAFRRDYKRYCGRGMDSYCEEYSAAELFRIIYNTSDTNRLVFQWGSCPECNGSGGYTYGPRKIAFASLPQSFYPSGNKTPEMAYRQGVNNVIHELGHAFALRWSKGGGYDNSGPYGTGKIPAGLVNNNGFYLYPRPEGAALTWRQHPCTTEDNCSHEVFADMFLGWTYGKWANNVEGVGNDRGTFMNQNMGTWIVDLVYP